MNSNRTNEPNDSESERRDGSHRRSERREPKGPPRSRGRGRGGDRGRRGGRGHRRHKVSRGDVRLGILALLGDEPMHGYQVMQELEERSGGAWRPSPGSVYPTLQQLADEGLITADKQSDRNVFSLTDAGREATKSSEGSPPWEVFIGDSHVDMRAIASSVVAASKQVSHVGTPEQEAAAAEILTDTRKRLYQLLAE